MFGKMDEKTQQRQGGLISEKNREKFKKMMPFADTVSSKSLLRSMKITPKNEIMKPAMFQGVRCSLRKKNAAIGVKRGIVAIMAELTTGAALSNP